MLLPELLAPAGSLEAFIAGFEAGADAFYMGAADFNARKRAKNFSNHDLRDAVYFAHSHNKKVYITLNTLVYDREIPGLTDLLLWLEELAVDGVIVQDLGVLDIVRRHFPSIPIHASTQLFCHNSLQAQFLKDAGVSRIVLSRELSLEEIRTIMEKVPLEYELFIHGAMCFSFSGCCHFSAHLFGKSGNRGECSQPCRMAFEADGKPRFPFSMKDLDASTVLPEILKLNPASLKIEGRMRSAAYVSETVAKYRGFLDSTLHGKVFVPGKQKVYDVERPACPGYYSSRAYETLISAEALPTIGKKIGKLLSLSQGTAFLRLAEHPQKGMRLRIQDAKGNQILTGTLLDFQTKKQDRNGFPVSWHLGEKNIPHASNLSGDVFWVGESAPTGKEKTVLARARTFKPHALKLQIHFRENELDVKAESSGFCFSAQYAMKFQPAQKTGETPKNTDKIFRETGETPFHIQSVSIERGETLFAPMSVMKEARRDFFARLSEYWRQEKQRMAMGKKEIVLEELKKLQDKYFQEIQSFNPAAFSEHIPLFVPDINLEEWKENIRQFIGKGVKQWLVPTYGWLAFFRDFPGLDLCAGPFLYAVNSFGMAFLEERGIQHWIASPDMKNEELKPVLSYPWVKQDKSHPPVLAVTRLSVPEKDYVRGNVIIQIKKAQGYCLLMGS